MATCGDALAPTRAAARTDRLEALLRAHLRHLAANPADLAVRREARAISRELKRRGDPAVNRGLAATAHARAALLALDEIDPARTLDACEAVLVLDPDQPAALRLLACAAQAAGLAQVHDWVRADLRALEGPAGPDADPRLAALVGDSPAMRCVRARLSAGMDSDLPLLLVGEPGTGKQLAATLLHAGGRQRAGELHVVHGDAPHEQLVRELLGREGSPGALSRPGTLLIVDAHRLSSIVQSWLGRRVRLSEAVRRGEFDGRRVAVPRIVLAVPSLEGRWPGPFVVPELARVLVRIELPPLRERPEDIALLAAHLLRGVRSKDGHPLRLRDEALRKFQRHTWPGNVDELAHALRVVVQKHHARACDAVPAERAHPVESVHAALTAALEHLFESVADAPAPAPAPAPPAPAPAPPADDLGDRIVASLAANDAGGLAQRLVQMAERVDARWVALWRVDAGVARIVQLGDRALADPVSATPGVFEPAPPGSVIARAVAACRASSTLDTGASDQDLLKLLSAGGLAPRTLLTVPVVTHTGRAIGVLLAGDRVGEESFTYADLGAIGVVAAGIARGARERGLDLLPVLARPAPAPAPAPREELVSAEPPVGWGPLPAHPVGLRAPRFTHEGFAAAVSAAVVFTALMLGAAQVLAVP